MEIKVKQRRTPLVKAIERSEKVAGQIYPVIIDKATGEIIDGRKRMRANPDWRIEEVEIESIEQKLAIKYHTVWFRQQLEKDKVLTEVAEETGWEGLEPFATFFGVSKETIAKHLPQKYKIRKHKKKENPYSDPLNKEKEAQKAIKKLKEVKTALDVVAPDAQEIKEMIEEAITKLEAFQPKEEASITIADQIEKWVEEMNPILSVWETHYDRPLGFGDKTFHGNCSPVIIMALLERYSFPTQTIIDPMAGSGTFGDVAKVMGYKEENVYMSDIKPLRDDITKQDAADLPYEDGFFDLVFAHLPYWNLVEYTRDDPLDASRFTLEEFLVWSERVMAEMRRVLRPKGHFVAMIGNKRQSGIIDLEAKLSEIGTRYFTLWDKVVKKIRPWGAEKRGARMQLAAARAKSQNRTMVNHDTILVFRKD